MYPENPEGTQVILGSMNMGYISVTARNRTHNLFHPKWESIPLDHSEGLSFNPGLLKFQMRQTSMAHSPDLTANSWMKTMSTIWSRSFSGIPTEMEHRIILIQMTTTMASRISKMMMQMVTAFWTCSTGIGGNFFLNYFLGTCFCEMHNFMCLFIICRMK